METKTDKDQLNSLSGIIIATDLMPTQNMRETCSNIKSNLEAITEELPTNKKYFTEKIPHTGDIESLDRCGS